MENENGYAYQLDKKDKEDSSGINNLIETLKAKNINQSSVHVQPPSNSHQSIIDFLLWVNNEN